MLNQIFNLIALPLSIVIVSMILVYLWRNGYLDDYNIHK